MKTYLLIAPALLLAACTAQSPNEQAAVDRSGEGSQATTKPSTAHPPASSRIGTAIGTIEAIDAATGKVTIAHDPVPSLDWPAMTMPFQATQAQIESLQPGQKVTFEFEESTTRIVRIEGVAE